jgi:hypothetical protein
MVVFRISRDILMTWKNNPHLDTCEKIFLYFPMKARETEVLRGQGEEKSSNGITSCRHLNLETEDTHRLSHLHLVLILLWSFTVIKPFCTLL